MTISLVEAAKLAASQGEDLKSGIIELFARSSDILNALTYLEIGGSALRYNREEKLPGVGFRGVNGSYTESTGILNPQVESLQIIGGDLDVDTFIVKTMGADQRSVHEAMQIKAIALRTTKAFIKGDNASDPLEFDGLQSRIVNDQLITAGTTAGGAALSLAILDQLIDQVDDPTHLLMNKTMRRRLTAAARDTDVGGFIQFELDAFGRRVAFYNDLPILIIDTDEVNVDILAFNEAASSGGATATSIYCVSLTPDGLQGIQNGGIDARDLGELDSKPAFRTRVEWFAGFALFRGTAAARLQHIGDLAVVV